MADEVKFIFKTLIKVPCIVIVAYFILNVYGIFYTWFTLIGIQNMLESTLANNNYINGQTMTSIAEMLDEIKGDTDGDGVGNGMIQSFDLYLGTNDATNEPVVYQNLSVANLPNASSIGTSMTTGGILGGDSPSNNIMSKCQYGNYKTVGIVCNFRIVWPLMPTEMLQDNVGGYAGFTADVNGGGGTANDWLGEAELENLRNDANHSVLIPITVRGTICGMKYYVDEQF